MSKSTARRRSRPPSPPKATGAPIVAKRAADRAAVSLGDVGLEPWIPRSHERGAPFRQGKAPGRVPWHHVLRELREEDPALLADRG